MAQALPASTHQLISTAQALIERIYPGWHIRRSRHGMWVADRDATPTPAQAAAGQVHHIIRSSATQLGAALAEESYRTAA